MKIVAKHTNIDKVYNIAETMIASIGDHSLHEVKGMEKEMIEPILDAVKSSVFAAVKVVAEGAESITVEYDLGAGIASSFENVCKFVKRVKRGEVSLENLEGGPEEGLGEE